MNRTIKLLSISTLIISIYYSYAEPSERYIDTPKTMIISRRLFRDKTIRREQKETATPYKETATPYSETEIKLWGLTVVNPFEDIERTGSLFNDRTYSNPNISGVTFRTSWEDLEPKEGEYNFKKLDEVFEKSEQNNKWVRLIIIPGFGTPDWALQGVQTAKFNIKYGRGRGEKHLLPMPWDEVYLNRWFSFLKELSKRYADRSSFRMIAAAGPTSVSSEMSIPNTREDLEIWKRMGYAPEKYVDSWKRVFHEYSQIFPKQYFSLALYPGLPIPTKKERRHVRQEIIEAGASGYPKQFSLQTSGLNPLKSENEGGGYLLVKQYSNQILTGFMTSSSFTKKQSKYGEPKDALQHALERGISAGAKYIEIYEDDILNPQMQNVLKNASISIKKLKQ